MNAADMESSWPTRTNLKNLRIDLEAKSSPMDRLMDSIKLTVSINLNMRNSKKKSAKTENLKT